MLQNILQQINRKADQEIKKIQVDKKEAILRLEKQAEQSLKQKQSQERTLLQQKVKKEIEQLQQKSELYLKFKVQEAKQKILDRIYEKALHKLTELPAPQFKKIIAQMAKSLPKTAGTISADPRTAKILRKITKQKVKGNSLDLGFVYLSPTLEIDCRFSEILKQKKEQIEPKLNKILFN